MADTKTSALTELTGPAADSDLVMVVDVSDTSMAASGTNKKNQAKNYLRTNGTANTLGANIAANGYNFTGAGTITTTGSSGFGTASPQRRLHVHGSSDGYVRVSTSTYTTGMDVGFDASSGYIWNYQNTALQIATNNVARMTIASDGKIGIGTASPTYLVDSIVGSGTQSIARFGQSGVSNGLTVASDGSTLTADMAGNLTITGGRIGEAWSALTLNTGGNWANYGGAYSSAGYKKIGDIVYVRGLVVRSSGTNTTIATLPSGYRPAAAHMFAVIGDGSLARIDVASSGAMTLEGGTAASFLSIFFSFSTL